MYTRALLINDGNPINQKDTKHKQNTKQKLEFINTAQVAVLKEQSIYIYIYKLILMSNNTLY